MEDENEMETNEMETNEMETEETKQSLALFALKEAIASQEQN